MLGNVTHVLVAPSCWHAPFAESPVGEKSGSRVKTTRPRNLFISANSVVDFWMLNAVSYRYHCPEPSFFSMDFLRRWSCWYHSYRVAVSFAVMSTR